MDYKKHIPKLIQNLHARNIASYFVSNSQEALDKILELIPLHATVGIGNSLTLKSLGVQEALSKRSHIIYNKTIAKTADEAMSLKKQALLADWYLTSANALTMEGHIVNIDHSGNRVAATLFGPDRVVIVVGINKITATLEEAIARARNHAAPQNALRASLTPPCTSTGKCLDCHSPDRVCNSLVIIEGQDTPNRMTVILINQDLGF